MPQGLSKSPSCFSQTLKAYLDDVNSPRGSKLLQYVDDLLLCSPSQASSREDSIHLLKLLASKRHRVSKEKLQFVQTQVCFLGHLISEQGLYIDPERLHGILNFLKPQTKCPLRGFLGLAGDYRNRVSYFSLMVQPLYISC